MDPELPSCIKEEVLTSNHSVSSRPDQLKLPSIKQETPTTEICSQSPSALGWNLDGRENEEAVTGQVDVPLPGDVTKPSSVTRYLQDVTQQSVYNVRPDYSPSTNDIKVEEACHNKTTSPREPTPCNEPIPHTITKELPVVMNFSPDDSPSTKGIKVEEARHNNTTSPQESASGNEPTTHTIKKELPMVMDSCSQMSNTADLNLSVQHYGEMKGITDGEVGSYENGTNVALVTDDTMSNSTTTESSRCSIPHDSISNPNIKTEPCVQVMSTSQMPSLNEQTTMPFLKRELPMVVEQPCNQTSGSLGCHLEEGFKMENAVNSDAEDGCTDARTKPPIISKNQSEKPSEILIPDNPSLSSDVIKTEPCHDVPNAQNPILRDQPSMPVIKEDTTNVDICQQQLSTEEFNVDCSLSHVSIEHKVAVTDTVLVGLPVDGAKSPPLNDVPNNNTPSCILPDDPLSRDAIKPIKTEPRDTPFDNSQDQVLFPTIKKERDQTDTNTIRGQSEIIVQPQQVVVTSVLSSCLHNPADSSIIQETGLNEEQLDEIANRKDETICESHVLSLSQDPETLSRIEDDKRYLATEDGIYQTKQKGTQVSPVPSTPHIQEKSSTVKNEQVFMIDTDQIGKETDGKAHHPTQDAVQTALSTSQHPARLVPIKEEQVSIVTNLVRKESSDGIQQGKREVVPFDISIPQNPITKEASTRIQDLVAEQSDGIQVKREVSSPVFEHEESSDRIQHKEHGVMLPELSIPQNGARSPVTKEASTRIHDMMAEQSDGIQVKRDVSSPVFEPVVCSNIGDLHGWEDLLNDNQETDLKEDHLLTESKTSEGDYERRSVPTQGPLGRNDEPLQRSIPVDSALDTVHTTILDKPDQPETTGNAESEAADMASVGRRTNETIPKEYCPPTKVDFSKLVALTNDSTVVQACLEDILSSVENYKVNMPESRGENFMMNLNAGVSESSPSRNDESLLSNIPVDLASTSSYMKERLALSTVQNSDLDELNQHGRTANEESETTHNISEGMDNVRACLDGNRSEDNSENVALSDSHDGNHVDSTSVDSTVTVGSGRNDSTKPQATNRHKTIETVDRLSKKKTRQNTKPRQFKSKPTSVSKAENVNPKSKSSMSKQNKKKRTSECHGNMPNRVEKDLNKHIASKFKSHKPLERLDASGLNVLSNPQRHADVVSPHLAAPPDNSRFKSNTEGMTKKRALKMGQPTGKRRKFSTGKTVKSLSSVTTLTESPENNLVGKQGTGKRRALKKVQPTGKQRKCSSGKTVTTSLPVTTTEVAPGDYFRSNEQVLSKKGQTITLGKDMQKVKQRKRSPDNTMETPLPVTTTAVSTDHRNIQERVKKRAMETGHPSGKRKKDSSEKTVETLPVSTTAVSTNEYFRSNKQAKSKTGTLEKEQTGTVVKEQRIVKQRQSSSEKAKEKPIPVATIAISPDDIRPSIPQQRRLKKRALRKKQLKGKRMQQTLENTEETYPVATTAVSPESDDDFRSNRLVRRKRAQEKRQPSGKRRNENPEKTMEIPLPGATAVVSPDDDRIRSNIQERVQKRIIKGQPSAKRRKQTSKKTVETLTASTSSVSPDDDYFGSNKQEGGLKKGLQKGPLNGKRRNLTSRKMVETPIAAAGLSDSQTDASYNDEHVSDDDEGTMSFSDEEENEHESGQDRNDEGNHIISATSAELLSVEDNRKAGQGDPGLYQGDTEEQYMEEGVQSSTYEVTNAVKQSGSHWLI